MLDEQIKKRITFNFGGQNLFFDVSQSLFSSYEIDIGTRMLINSLRKNKEIRYNKILDLGCGYGAIGIFLKKQNPSSEVHCTDRDNLAVEFAESNAKFNYCIIKAYPSLDYLNIKEKKFDLIVCNFPAKAGINAMKKFVWDASLHLNSEGIFAIVIVKELEEDFNKIKRDEMEIIYKEKKAGYFIYHIKYKSKISFEGDVYSRGEGLYFIENKKYFIKTARNIPDFDNPSFISLCIEKILKKLNKVEEVVLINPFQGHRAILAMHYLKPKKIILCSRDLLQLMFSEKNLKLNGFENISSYEKEYLEKELGGILIWVFDKEENIQSIKEKLKLLNYEKIIIGGTKREIEMISKGVKIAEEEEMKGFKAILIYNRR